MLISPQLEFVFILTMQASEIEVKEEMKDIKVCFPLFFFNLVTMSFQSFLNP